MKKPILTITLCLALFGTAFAKTDDDKKSAFQLSFITPLSTNGLHAAQYTNGASFNILVGTSANEKAFTFGGLSNIIMNNADGFQFAGLSNYVGNEGGGFQFAGLTNVNKHGFKGFQFAGLTNVAGNTKGFQFAGLVNVAKDVKGFQFAGLINVAKDVKGVQFAGLINVAKDVKGVQFAGLINIAENSDCPIGLINIIKNGEMGIAVTYDAIGNAVLSFRSGGKYTYGILGVGYNHKAKGNALVTEAGFGAHIPIASWFRINNELKATNIGSNEDKPMLNGGYSLIPAFLIGNHVELFAGASINYMKTWDLKNSHIFPNHSLWKRSGAATLEQVYIGYQVGVQYIF